MNRVASNIVKILSEANKPMRPVEIYKAYIEKFPEHNTNNHLEATIRSTLQSYSKEYRDSLPIDSKFHNRNFNENNDDLFSIVEILVKGNKVRHWTLKNVKNNVSIDVSTKNDEWKLLFTEILTDKTVSSEIKTKLKKLLNL